jgi:3',5'-cyclic AMP phosphodiesterase CpdA
MNYRLLGRGWKFRDAGQVLDQWKAELARRHPDHIIFSGDATCLGFETELARAAALLEVADQEGIPGLAVPGNHDYYNREAALSGCFERYFAPWQGGERIQGETYPFAQRTGPLWLVGVNSCTGNFWSWDAAGTIDAPQLDRLRHLLSHLSPGPRILVTHYPVCLESGRPERRFHRLRNAAEAVRVAKEGGVCLWLHGHRHNPYVVSNPEAAPFPIICAGSVTQRPQLAYAEYTIEGRQVHALRRVYSPQSLQFEDRETFDVELAI